MDNEDLEKTVYGPEGYGTYSGQVAQHLNLKKKLKRAKESDLKEGTDHVKDDKRPDYQSRIHAKGKGGKV